MRTNERLAIISQIRAAATELSVATATKDDAKLLDEIIRIQTRLAELLETLK